MNRRSSYAQKLLDPRWQKKRLEVMSYRDFACEICGDTESTLHVHHKQYLKGFEPWDYQVDQLACICESCHFESHKKVDLLNLICSYAPIDGFANRDECAALLIGLLNKTKKNGFEGHEQKFFEIGEFIMNNGCDFVLKKLKGRKNG